MTGTIAAVKPMVIDVWLGDGSVSNSDALLEGDLVQINLMGTWPSDNPSPGIFMGVCEDELRGQVVRLETPDKLLDSNAHGSSCSTRMQTFPVDKIAHIQFLARGHTAVHILFHHFIGRLMAEKDDLRERMKKIKDILPFLN